jgi:hypothetical protein
MNNLERLVRELTTEINGQYPRPWMTSMRDPSSAKVFVVGYNPAKAYSAQSIDYERHIDALFNRNGETCRGLYSEVTKESPTRGNIEMLTAKLAAVGVKSVLETNVVCYATSKKKDLSKPNHFGGKPRGVEIFRTIVREIRPRSMIIHGAGVREEFNRSFTDEPNLPPPPNRPGMFPQIDLSTGTRVCVIPSLALPGYQNWPPQNSFCNWADEYLDELAVQIARYVPQRSFKF